MLWIEAPNNLNTEGAFKVRIFTVYLNGGISIELKNCRINALAYFVVCIILNVWKAIL